MTERATSDIEHPIADLTHVAVDLGSSAIGNSGLSDTISASVSSHDVTACTANVATAVARPWPAPARPSERTSSEGCDARD